VRIVVLAARQTSQIVRRRGVRRRLRRGHRSKTIRANGT
jgi:hypothetical protein